MVRAACAMLVASAAIGAISSEKCLYRLVRDEAIIGLLAQSPCPACIPDLIVSPNDDSHVNLESVEDSLHAFGDDSLLRFCMCSAKR